jgi:hypothetical protein
MKESYGYYMTAYPVPSLVRAGLGMTFLTILAFREVV